MKNRNRILIIGSCILLGCTLLFIIKTNKDLIRIKTDWESTFIDRKLFFKSCAFSGKVISKAFIENTNLHYSLTITLDTNTLIPQWGERVYPHYYEFDSEKKRLTFLVSEYIYRNIEANSIIIKKEKSDSIFINDKAYELLSSESLEWAP